MSSIDPIGCVVDVHSLKVSEMRHLSVNVDLIICMYVVVTREATVHAKATESMCIYVHTYYTKLHFMIVH